MRIHHKQIVGHLYGEGYAGAMEVLKHAKGFQCSNRGPTKQCAWVTRENDAGGRIRKAKKHAGRRPK